MQELLRLRFEVSVYACHDVFEVQMALLVLGNRHLPGSEYGYAIRQKVVKEVVDKAVKHVVKKLFVV